MTPTPATMRSRSRGRKTLDVDDHRVNGHGYVGGEASVPGDIPTVPLDYPASGEDTLLPKPEPELPAEATEAFTVPEAAPPSRGPSRWLRALIGVDESLLESPCSGARSSAGLTGG
jgi:hypothetical protein